MGKTMLIAGKEMPAGERFADAVVKGARNVIITVEELPADDYIKKTIAEKRAAALLEEELKAKEAATGICTIGWSKVSPISARTLILQTENFFERMDEAVLYFDEDWLAQSQGLLDAEECSRVADELIVGFQHLTLEVLVRFEKLNNEGNPGILVFLLRDSPSVADALRVPSLRNGVNGIASPVIAAATSAFASFAENIAAVYFESSFVNIVLVRCDKSIEDAELARWLTSHLDAMMAPKTKASAKKTIGWIKPGAKTGGMFGGRLKF
ncbi:MAG: hypothetical protein J1D88_02160 [Treponema sp.]|nr:hypothetical protein [Treponema sp.]